MISSLFRTTLKMNISKPDQSQPIAWREIKPIKMTDIHLAKVEIFIMDSIHPGTSEQPVGTNRPTYDAVGDDRDTIVVEAFWLVMALKNAWKMIIIFIVSCLILITACENAMEY